MDSWSETKSFMVVMAVIVAFYLLGRWVAETLQAMDASGALPTL
jgi:hypothetical protein